VNCLRRLKRSRTLIVARQRTCRRPVSIRQIQRVMFHLQRSLPTRIADGEFRILQYIAWDARPDGRRQYVTPRKLAENAGFPIATINLALRRFAERGWMTVLREDGRVVDWQLTIERDDLLKSLLKSCGNPVENSSGGVMQDREIEDAGSPDRDPASQQIGVNEKTYRGLAVLSVFSPSSFRLKEEEKAALRAAPSPNLHSENADPEPPAPTDADAPPQPSTDELSIDDVRARLATLKARLEATPPPARRRRPR
jgi:hypothetical protein